MDPVTLIATAVEAVKDAYSALKALITRRYRGVDVTPVERKPESEAKRGSLAEDLAAAGADADAELLEAARQVIAHVKAHEAATGAALGIDLERVEAAALRIRGVESEGTGVRVRDGRFTGDIDIGDVRAGQERPNRP